MIRLLIVDDHPAMRAGLTAVLRAEPGIVPLGTASSEADLGPTLARTRPDVVLLDYHLPKGDGLQLCYRIKQDVPAPRVIVFSAYAGADMVPPARLARADGLLSKGVGARELFEAIRRVAKGEALLGELSATILRDSLARIPEDDRALAGMLLDGASEPDVARTLGLDLKDVRHAVQRTLSTLRHGAAVTL
jgi:DNA-binding NarL/FixJ family response regulator